MILLPAFVFLNSRFNNLYFQIISVVIFIQIARKEFVAIANLQFSV